MYGLGRRTLLRLTIASVFSFNFSFRLSSFEGCRGYRWRCDTSRKIMDSPVHRNITSGAPLPMGWPVFVCMPGTGEVTVGFQTKNPETQSPKGASWGSCPRRR